MKTQNTSDDYGMMAFAWWSASRRSPGILLGAQLCNTTTIDETMNIMLQTLYLRFVSIIGLQVSHNLRIWPFSL